MDKVKEDTILFTCFNCMKRIPITVSCCNPTGRVYYHKDGNVPKGSLAILDGIKGTCQHCGWEYTVHTEVSAWLY